MKKRGFQILLRFLILVLAGALSGVSGSAYAVDLGSPNASGSVSIPVSGNVSGSVDIAWFTDAPSTTAWLSNSGLLTGQPGIPEERIRYDVTNNTGGILTRVTFYYVQNASVFGAADPIEYILSNGTHVLTGGQAYTTRFDNGFSNYYYNNTSHGVTNNSIWTITYGTNYVSFATNASQSNASTGIPPGATASFFIEYNDGTQLASSTSSANGYTPIKYLVFVGGVWVRLHLPFSGTVGGVATGAPLSPPSDTDGDGVPDSSDNCPSVYNPDQADTDLDGIGDACDPCPTVPNQILTDSDEDGVPDVCDNCPAVENPDQLDTDLDGTGDACEVTTPAPTGLSVTILNSTATLAWNPVTDPDLQGYQVKVRRLGCEITNCSFLVDAGLATTTAISRLPCSEDGYGFSVAYTNGEGSQSLFSPEVSGEVLCATADADGDGVLDVSDNCKFKYNPDQQNSDSDTFGDLCDNCPKVSNPGQEDAVGDGLGDACRIVVNVLGEPSFTTLPGAPLPFTTNITNLTSGPIYLLNPNQYNTFFSLTDPTGNSLDARCKIGPPYRLPMDIITLAPGESVPVTVDLSEWYDTTELSGTYTVSATYFNWIDPANLNPPPDCTAPGCDSLLVGSVKSGTGSVTISGTPVEKVQAKVGFTPSSWYPSWSSQPPGSGTVSASITYPGIGPGTIDPASIRLNGTVPIVGSPVFTAGSPDGTLTVQFDRSLAVQSLGKSPPAGFATPTVTGNIGNPATRVFSGTGRIDWPVTLIVSADQHIVGTGTKPGSTKVPIVGMETRVYDKSCLTAKGYGISWQNYPSIWNNESQCRIMPNLPFETNSLGQVEFPLDAGNYIVIGNTSTTSIRDSSGNPIYPGVIVPTLKRGAVARSYLQVVTTSTAKTVPAKYTIKT